MWVGKQYVIIGNYESLIALLMCNFRISIACDGLYKDHRDRFYTHYLVVLLINYKCAIWLLLLIIRYAQMKDTEGICINGK